MKVIGPDPDLQPPDPAGLGLAMGLSLLAHALLVLALAWGVKWTRTDPSVAFNAEVWAPTVVEAAPARPAPPEPTPPPPEPERKSAPPPPPPPAARERAAQRDAEIATEKRRKDEARKKKEEEKDNREKQAREKADREKERKAEKARQDEERRDAELRAQMRQDELKRQRQERQQQTSASTPPPATPGTGSAESKGTAVRSAAPSSSYAGLIVRRIRENTTYNSAKANQLTVVVMVRTEPDGKIREVKVVTSSGDRLFDAAVERGVKKMSTVPEDVDGKIPDVLRREGLEITVSL
jgi:colicin import membrane protein